MTQQPPQQQQAHEIPESLRPTEEALWSIVLERMRTEERSRDFVNKLVNADPQEQARLCAAKLESLEAYYGRNLASYKMQDTYRKDILQVAACGWLDPNVLSYFRFEDQDAMIRKNGLMSTEEMTSLGDRVNRDDLEAVIRDASARGNISGHDYCEISRNLFTFHKKDYCELNTKLSELLDEQFQEPSSTAPELPEQEIYEPQQRSLGEAMFGQSAQEQLREEYLDNLSLGEPEHEIGDFDL
jgi:hypothetical protein